MNIFDRTGGLRPGRSVFDLSYSKIFNCRSGELIPVMCDEVVPGDFFDIGNEVVVRMQPLVAPLMHAINIFVHYFFVPYRLLWDSWEDFITGGKLGTDASVLPRWSPNTPTKGTLWDHFGFPLVNLAGLDRPMIFPFRAYVMIWNEYYRDETLQTEVDAKTVNGPSNGTIYKRDWRKDYFTSALPWQQRGTAPALPITGTSRALWPAGSVADAGTTDPGNVWSLPLVPESKIRVSSPGAHGVDNLKNFLESNTVDLSSAVSVTINELRQSVQIQKWLERNARGGIRYTEFLREHFGVSPRDERLQRPEYIGGSKQPIITSEVLKTAQDGTRPLGNLSGHGLSASKARCARKKVEEYGLIMGLMSIMPEPMYNSQGIDRQWLRRSKYDFFFPEFAHLSEQAIEREEIYATTVEADNRTIFGYQGRYDEMRFKRNMTAGDLRDTLSYWHMGRTFASAPALNEAFIQCDGTQSSQTQIFAVTSEPGYLVHFGNIIKAARPLPTMSDPGLMDHF